MLTEEDEKIILKNTLREMLTTVKVFGIIAAGVIAFFGIIIGITKVFGGSFQDGLMVNLFLIPALSLLFFWFIIEYGAAEEKYKKEKTLRR